MRRQRDAVGHVVVPEAARPDAEQRMVAHHVGRGEKRDEAFGEEARVVACLRRGNELAHAAADRRRA